MEKFNLIGIASQDGLIPGSASRKILNDIKNNVIDDEYLLKHQIPRDKILALTRLYQEKIKSSPLQRGQPRYLPFYHILKDKFPQINWEIKSRLNHKPIVNFSLPLIGNLQPSPFSFLIDRIIATDSPKYLSCYRCLHNRSDEIINLLENFMKKAVALLPSERLMSRLLQWIEQAQSGVVSTIFIHTCPDYSIQPTNNPERPYKHTFESLGDGIGQIAKRIINLLPDLKNLLINLGINPKMIATIADYEAFSLENLERVQLNKSEFLARVESSRKNFELACQNTLPIKTYLLTDLCNGEEFWLKKVEELKQQFAIGNFGLSDANQNIFLKIATQRKALYANWFGRKASIQEYIPIAINQAAEYSAIAYYVTTQFENCLILGADSECFEPFYSFYQKTPTLYFKRFYY